MNASALIDELQALGDADTAAHSQRFFKTGKGEYGEGDVFLGIRVPDLRKLAKARRDMALTEIKKLLRSKYHEVRLCALLILVYKYERADEAERAKINDLYLANTKHINNWDLVDTSAHAIVGAHLHSGDRSVLYRLAASDDLWEKRIAMIATYHFIKQDDFNDALKIADALLHDEHDLIHKAVGWMLREIGHRDGEAERAFLKDRYKAMPRTMLRYAIEKFPEKERKRYLGGEV